MFVFLSLSIQNREMCWVQGDIWLLGSREHKQLDKNCNSTRLYIEIKHFDDEEKTKQKTSQGDTVQRIPRSQTLSKLYSSKIKPQKN